MFANFSDRNELTSWKVFCFVYLKTISLFSVSLKKHHLLSPIQQVEAYDADELNYHGGVRVSFGMQLMGAAARIEREIPSIGWPFLLLHGDADKLCHISGSKLMYDNAPSSDKKIKVGFSSHCFLCFSTCQTQCQTQHVTWVDYSGSCFI